MPWTRTGIPSLIVMLFLMAGSGSAVGDEVRRVRNGATPRDGGRTEVLEELWRAGDEGGDVFFGRVPRVETDRQGNIYVLDAQLCRVHVYSPDGEPLPDQSGYYENGRRVR